MMNSIFILNNISGLKGLVLQMIILLLFTIPVVAQDENEDVTEDKPARAAFESAWLIDGQSSYIYNKKTLEFVIQHRFGVVTNGSSDLWGMYGPSNIRLGMAYAPINKLNVGVGYTKLKQLLDFSAKYGLFEQTRSNSMPVSLVYYVNMGIELRADDNYINSSDRLSYFHQLIIARRFSSKFSLQVAPSFIHYNATEGYVDTGGSEPEIKGKMSNDSWGINTSGRFKFSPQSSIIASYDQPLTEHFTNNPKPGISLGIEVCTSSHAFQVFFSNYNRIIPQENYMYNQNDYREGEWLIGFNITRTWGF
jgi:hypothetical protein